jgi:hypothetical protein
MRGISLLPEAPLALLGLTEISKNPVEDGATFLAALLKSIQRRMSQSWERFKGLGRLRDR